MASPPRMTLPDGLRAVAALLVILAHSVGLFACWPAPNRATRAILWLGFFGHTGVQIFFVLSGFVIAYSLRNEAMTAENAVKFIVRRSIRLAPPYWAAIAFYAVYLICRRSLTSNDVTLPTPAQMVSHLFYLQNILGYGDINIAFWTLCIEVQFYLVFCMLLGLVHWRGDRTAGGTQSPDRRLFAMLYIFALAWPAQLLSGDAPVSSLFLPHWYAFLLGAIVWWVVEGSLPRVLAHGAILLLFAIWFVRSREEPLVVAGTASLILIAGDRDGLFHWLDIGWVQLLGELSYSMYLVHVPIAGALLAIHARMAPEAQLASFVMLALVIATTIGTAFLLHHFIEAPSTRLSRRINRTSAYKLLPELFTDSLIAEQSDAQALGRPYYTPVRSVDRRASSGS